MHGHGRGQVGPDIGHARHAAGIEIVGRHHAERHRGQDAQRSGHEPGALHARPNAVLHGFGPGAALWRVLPGGEHRPRQRPSERTPPRRHSCPARPVPPTGRRPTRQRATPLSLLLHHASCHHRHGLSGITGARPSRQQSPPLPRHLARHPGGHGMLGIKRSGQIQAIQRSGMPKAWGRLLPKPG
ncbi:hypothetical protein IP65_12655 [Novosphingobium sp. AAP1]|nr:hypothetical protein IP65_12655 [Novosphingobium sp. AAP1]